jgi:DHA1 family solute carrier family 18 vesicular amine transporter 1/2
VRLAGRLPAPLLAVLCGVAFADLLLWLAVLPVLPHWERTFGFGTEGAGLVLAAYSASLLIASVPAGHLADRVGTKRVTIAATVALAATAPALALAGTTWELVVARGVQGLAAAVSWSAGLAWLLAATPAERRTRTLATVNGSATAATLAGPLVGGPLVSWIGFGPAMWAFAALVGALAIVAAAMPGSRAGASQERAPSLLAAARLAARSRSLRIAFVAMAFVSVAAAAAQLLVPLRLGREGLSGAEIGWILTGTAVIALAETVVFARIGDRIDQLRTILIAMVAVTATLAALAIGLGLGGLIVLLTLLQAATLPVFVLTYPVCVSGAAQSRVGAAVALGALNAVWAGGSLVAPLALGALASAVSDGAAYGAAAALGVLALALVWVSRPRAPLPDASAPAQ